MAVYVVSDSTAYLPMDVIERYGIKIVPLNVSIGNETFKEGTGYSNTEYYRRLRSENIFPTTSQPSAGDFYEVFSEFESGDTIIGIFISTGLSGTVHSAKVAKAMLPDRNIIIIDSQNTIAGLGFQVMRACELAEAGADPQSIVAEIMRIQERLCIHFVVDNLEYLVRGGRLSKVGQWLGNVLQVRPILQVENGVIKVYDKVRTKNKALERIIQDFSIRWENGEVERICVIHVGAAEEAQRLHAKVTSIFPRPVMIGEVGPVIGSHVGPGSLGLAYY